MIYILIAIFSTISITIFLLIKYNAFQISTNIYDPSKYAFWLVVFLSFCTACSLSLTELFFPVNKLVIFSIKNLILFVMLWTSLIIPYIVFFIMTHKLLNQFSYTLRVSSSPKFFWQAFFLILMIGFVYWIIFFPANMSADSFETWEEIKNNYITDYHSIAYAFIQKILIKIWDTPAIISLVQIIAFAWIMAVWMNFFYQQGLPGKFIMILFGAASAMPNTGIMIVTLWKDIPFTIVILGLVYLMLNFVLNPKLRTKTYMLVNIGILLGLSIVFRINGVAITFMGILILLGFAFIHQSFKIFWLPVFVCMVVSVLNYGVLYKALNVHKSSVTNNRNNMIFMPINTAYLYGVQDYLHPNVRKFAQTIDENIWKSYGTTFVNNFFWQVRGVSPESLAALEEGVASKRQYVEYYVQLWTGSPLIHFRTRLNFWDPFWNSRTQMFLKPFTEMSKSAGIISRFDNPIINKIRNIFRRLNDINLIIFPLWLNTLFLIFCGVYWIIYGDRRNLIILFPWIVNSFVLFWVSPSTDYRYFWMGIFLAVISIPLTLIQNKRVLL